jgi:hypothetical protein
MLSFITKKKGTPFVKEKRHTFCSGVPFLSNQKTVCDFPFENEPPGPFLQAIESGNHNFIITYLPFHFVLLK